MDGCHELWAVPVMRGTGNCKLQWHVRPVSHDLSQDIFRCTADSVGLNIVQLKCVSELMQRLNDGFRLQTRAQDDMGKPQGRAESLAAVAEL